MRTQFQLRLASRRDAKSLSEMNYEFNKVAIGEAAINLKLSRGHEIVAIAEQDRGTIAFACAQVYDSFCYKTLQAELTELYVRNGFRRNGIGSGLIRFMEDQIAKRHGRHIHILTGSLNRSAQTLYRRILTVA